MECGDILNLGNQYFLVLRVEEQDSVFLIWMKDLQTGQEKKELFTSAILEEYSIKKVPFTYLNTDEQYHYFRNEKTQEKVVYRKPLIGTDLDYFLKKKSYPLRVNPVYTNVDWEHIPLGTKLELKTDCSQAKIFYTLDGTDPDQHSLVYQKPIPIDSPCLLKAVAKEPGKKDSFIKKWYCGFEKGPIKFYLSPSKQSNNFGIEGSGFTNEMNEMNLICDRIETELKTYDCLVFRNDRNTYIADWTLEGKEKAIDLHFALHSNASSTFFKKGMEIWINDEDSDSYGLAHAIYQAVYQIYYDQNSLTNRGIKYAKGSLAEVNPVYTHCGILLEVAYHDKLDDARWIIEHRNEIAHQIVQALVQYYQLRKKEKL